MEATFETDDFKNQLKMGKMELLRMGHLPN